MRKKLIASYRAKLVVLQSNYALKPFEPTLHRYEHLLGQIEALELVIRDLEKI